MSVSAFIADTAARLGFTDISDKVPEYGQHVELFLPAEFPHIKSYIEFEFVRGVFTMYTSEYGPLSPADTAALEKLPAERVEHYGTLYDAVLINPKLDIAEDRGVLLVRSYQTMYWRDAAQSVLSQPKVFPFAKSELLPK